MKRALKKILLVDDEPDILEVFRVLLSQHPFDVATVADGHRAMDFVKKNKVDLVISDIRMPRCDGLRLLDELHQYFQEPPMVLLVSGYTEITESEALKRGAMKYLKKPVQGSQLVSAVFECFGMRSEKR